MSDSRRRTRETSNDDLGSPVRVVAPRRSIFFEDSDPTDHIDRVEETEPSEEPRPTLSRSPPAIHPSVLSSPIIPTHDSPSPPRCRADSRRWDWMPEVLKEWRQTERIPILPETPGSQAPIAPLTLEPAHHTVPILITRLHTFEHQLRRLEHAANDRMDAPTSEVELLQHQVSVLETDLAELRDMMVAAHNEGVEEVMLLRQQLEESQRRTSEMEQEMATMRADMGQLRAVAANTTRMVELLERMDERLR